MVKNETWTKKDYKIFNMCKNSAGGSHSIYLNKHTGMLKVYYRTKGYVTKYRQVEVSMVLISSLINIKISPNLQVTKAAISNFKYHLIIMIHQCTSACDVWYCIFIDLQLIFQLVVFHDRLWPMYGNYKNVFCGKKYGSPSAPYEKKNIYLAIAR